MQIPFISIIITHELEISKAAAWCPKAAFSAKKKGVQPISISGYLGESSTFCLPFERLKKRPIRRRGTRPHNAIIRPGR